MTIVGMFHYRKNPEKVFRAYSYASIAKMEGVEFFYFSSKRVNLENKTINGLTYQDGKWIEKIYPFPDVVMNVVGPITKKQQHIYQELKRSIPFISFPVGSKLSVYNRIKKGKEFKSYLLPYKKVRKPIDVLFFLKKHNKVIIKPITGHHGHQVIYIESKEENYIVKEKAKLMEITRINLLDYIGMLIEKKKVLMQKYVCCKRQTGEPYDIRLHIQKNQDGKWVNTIIYPKIGFKNKITTNLAQGGQMMIMDNFLYKEFGEEYINIKRYLEMFALQFGTHFDTLYQHEFDELGIDVGLDENKKIWIYEVKWRPEHLYIENKAAHHALLYASYIAKKRGEKDEDIKDK